MIENGFAHLPEAAACGNTVTVYMISIACVVRPNKINCHRNSKPHRHRSALTITLRGRLPFLLDSLLKDLPDLRGRERRCETVLEHLIAKLAHGGPQSATISSGAPSAGNRPM
jgi:hypothetical protein